VSVTRAQVREIAALARLLLNEEETTRFAVQLATILDHALELEQAAEDVMPDRGGSSAALPLRADAPGADALALPPAELAPAWHDGFFTVPRLSAMQTGAGPDTES
jgi:aspartyl/glutamyl-tRNA(Asn/Gln) amidotransferase C subunit